MRTVILIFLVLTITGCCYFVPCSRFIYVQGHIQNQEGKTYKEECELFIVDEGRKWEAPWSVLVSGSFFVPISIATYDNEYALQIECRGYQPYITAEFKANAYSEKPYSLGVINLVPES